jgi:hypothetical protein
MLSQGSSPPIGVWGCRDSATCRSGGQVRGTAPTARLSLAGVAGEFLLFTFLLFLASLTREKEENKLHGLFCAKDGIYRRATDSALTFERWFAIFHCYLLSILHLSFFLTFDAIV